jgi:hypothetical protein
MRKQISLLAVGVCSPPPSAPSPPPARWPVTDRTWLVMPMSTTTPRLRTRSQGSTATLTARSRRWQGAHSRPAAPGSAPVLALRERSRQAPTDATSWRWMPAATSSLCYGSPSTARRGWSVARSRRAASNRSASQCGGTGSSTSPTSARAAATTPVSGCVRGVGSHPFPDPPSRSPKVLASVTCSSTAVGVVGDDVPGHSQMRAVQGKAGFDALPGVSTGVCRSPRIPRDLALIGGHFAGHYVGPTGADAGGRAPTSFRL